MQVRILVWHLCNPVLRLIGSYPFTGGGQSEMARSGVTSSVKLCAEVWRGTLPGTILNHQILQMFI